MSLSSTEATMTRWFVRFLRAFRAWQQRAVEREVERFIARNGGRLTDALEREIANRMMAGRWDPSANARYTVF
jgi:hypothetical protein